MRQILSIVMMWLTLGQLVPAAYAAESVGSQIGGMPVGAQIEVRLKNREKMRGTRGAVADSGFTLVDARAGEQQIAFNDVASVKQMNGRKSHVTRNVVIVVAIGVAIFATVLGIQYARCGPLGCRKP